MSLNDIKIKEIIGLKVVALKGLDKFHKERFFKNEKLPINYILFNDEKSFIELSVQDEDIYHDYDEDARQITFYQNKEKWKDIIEYVNADDFVEFID